MEEIKDVLSIKLCQQEIVGTSIWLSGRIVPFQSVLGLFLMSFNVSIMTFMNNIIFFLY